MGNLEKSIIDHSGLAIAGHKISCLQSFHFSDYSSFYAEYLIIKEKLLRLGVSCDILSLRRSSALFLIYNVSTLKLYLSNNMISLYLEKFGYESKMSVEEKLLKLKQRMSDGKFPHEVAVFLGYPLDDIEGFMINPQNYKYAGMWKVYSNVTEKKQLFEKYKKIKEEIKNKALLCSNIEQVFI